MGWPCIVLMMGIVVSGGTTICLSRFLPVLSKKFLYKTLLTTSSRFLFFFTSFWKKELVKLTRLGSGSLFVKYEPFFGRPGYLTGPG